ncbi:MAG: type II toxin-antitoxin system PemK/MazF family toxin [Acetobacteraceae bacterium]|nr:type II toxin-antitoxin system PemK/MazF family toxin [Acetobacteraceae bacterium]
MWDIVRVPFPHADRPARSFRPALVVATPEAGAAPPVVWVLMITAADNPPWPADVLVAPKPGNGLPIPSRVRVAKIATVNATQVERIGRLGAAERTKVAAGLRSVMAEIVG